MNPSIAIAFVTVSLGVSRPVIIFAQSNLLEMPVLKALAAVESGFDNNKRGNKGETGIYQISKSLWKEHGRIFSRSERLQSELAHEHITHCLIPRFHARTKRYATNRDVYFMWNLGFDGYASCAFEPAMVNRISRDAAQRYDNLVKAYGNKN